MLIANKQPFEWEKKRIQNANTKKRRLVMMDHVIFKGI